MRSELCCLALAAVTASVAIGCPAAEEPGSCAADADCPSGRTCNGGTCGPPPQSWGGSGGEVVAADACGTSTDCLPGPFPLIPTVIWDGSLDGEDEVCTVPIRSCPGAQQCDVPTVCAPALADATRLGAMRCERDDQCASGRCVLLESGISVCLRSCVSDGDCPAIGPPEVDTPAGFRCGSVVQAGIPLRLCVPLDDAFPERTLCRNDCDCPADGCPAGETEPLCRFVGDRLASIEAVPVCDRAPAGLALRPTLSQCRREPESCRGGACVAPCQIVIPNYESFCDEPPTRCTQPCEADRDCPARTVCRDGTQLERIGGWLLPAQDLDGAGRIVRYCQIPQEGCYDELDCCPEPDGQGGCLKGWSADRKRCAVQLAPPADRPRLLTGCLALDMANVVMPGECCAQHAECDSNLCVPARDGTACAGGGVCSVPCDPDPFPSGGATYQRDRCSSADFGASTYHQLSSCRPFRYLHPYTDRDGAAAVLDVELNACQ